MTYKRVVITGIGALTPIGNTVPEFWNSLLEGVSGAGPITYFNPENLKTRFACQLKGFDVHNFIGPKEARRMDRVAHYAVVATEEALRDSNLDLTLEDLDRAGIIYGTAAGGYETSVQTAMHCLETDYHPRYSPLSLPMVLADSVAGNLALRFGLRGPNYVTSSSCASGGNAIIDAMNYIRMGKCDFFVCGGAEACVNFVSIAGFGSMRALSTRNEEPERASRPFDADRDGFVMGEGAATLILEELDHALARGAHIYAEIAGAGMTCDAYHITAPRADGDGARKAMAQALCDAGLKAWDVDYVNAHGTATTLGDASECCAIGNLFGKHAEKLLISSTKSMTGHMLGAAPAIESVASILAINNAVAPPTINLDHKDPQLPDWNFCANVPVKRDIRVAISNSFGFGGHNISIVFKRFEK